MKIETFSSGSIGNAYRISDSKTTLLLECGIPFRKLQKHSGYKLSEVAACLITHEHGDHAKAVHDLISFGVPVWCSYGTAQVLKISDSLGVQIVHHMTPVQCGTMIILPISVFHDAAEPLGWMIESEADGERLVFITDTGYADYIFPACNYIMVECNHMGECSMGSTNAFLAKRVAENHLSLDSCVRFLRMQDLSKIQAIYLIHISQQHGNPKEMQQTVAKATGKLVFATV